MTMLIATPNPVPVLPVTTEGNFTSNPATPNTGQVTETCQASLPTRGKQNYKRHLYSRPKTCPVKSCSHVQVNQQLLPSELELDLELNLEETPLTECRKCQSIATYLDLCYFHWQEQASYSAFQPEVTEAIAAYHLAGSSF